jgi:oligoribonuclease (3'-5' exoribonuclease)
MSESPRSIWFVTDIETTGLDKDQDSVVEIASIAVDAKTLHELGRFHTLASPAKYARFPDPFILRMKSQNGLWEALAEKNIPDQKQAVTAFKDFLDQHQPTGKITLAGDSVHFDLGFLNKMSDEVLAPRLNHRVINISTFRDTFVEWGIQWVVDDKTPGHRAMADAEKSLDKLRLAMHHCKR